MNNELRKRIIGVLKGGALGDAYGMPTEFWSYQKLKNEFPDGINEMMASLENQFIPRSLPQGSITDDTINTLMILETIEKNKGVLEAEDYIQALTSWIENSENAELVSGPSTLRAVRAIKNGLPMEKSGIGNTTNGAAMKISPIGLISDYKNLEQLIENVHEICYPTHNTSIAVTGAAVVAACISYVASGGQQINDLWELALKTVEKSKGYGIDFPSPSLEFRIRYAREIVERYQGEDAIEKLVFELGTGVETIETIPAVLAIVQIANGNPTKAARIGAGIGADTDTIASIAASICGGMNQTFVEEDILLLERVNSIDFEGLTDKILPYSPYYKG